MATYTPTISHKPNVLYMPLSPLSPTPYSIMSADRAEPGSQDELAEFSLRPLRIRKRTDPAPVSAPEQSTSRRNSAHSDSTSEFVCRPMRLSLASQAGHKSDDHLTSPKRGAAKTVAQSAQGLPRRTSIHIKNLPFKQKPQETGPVLGDMVFAVCLVDFHHVRGPEIQWWRSNYHKKYLPEDKLFRNLSFQALPDGSHLFEETFSNFNLVYDFNTGVSLDNLADIELFRGNPNHLETLFGCSCVRQVKTTDLPAEELERNKDITRSIVQKAVVVITRKQPVFTKIKEKLSIITHSYFQQSNFTNFELLEDLFENLKDSFKLVEDDDSSTVRMFPSEAALLENKKNERQEEFFVNLNLRHILRNFKTNILVILKALLLEKRVLVYSNDNLELLTQFQNNLIAIIPDLLNNLELSGCPLSDYTEKHAPLLKPTSLKTNDRKSMLRFFGLPLQIFNTKGSFWNPYLPLQQLDELTTKTFMVGCSNLLIANQLAKFKVDLLVDIDTHLVSFPSGKCEDLGLSSYDKKFIANLLATHQTGESYVGSDDYMRYQFEDYIRSMLSTTRFQQYYDRFKSAPPGFDLQTHKHMGDLRTFNEHFITAWFETENFKIWDAMCDEFIFNFHDPVHIACGMDEPTPYLSNFFSFRKTSQPQGLADIADQYFSHAQKPQKFISETEDNPKEEETPAKKSAWNWGFKK